MNYILMQKWFDKYFSMNRKELQGVSFLTIVVVFLWFLPNLYRWLVPSKQPIDFTLREKEIQTFLANMRNKNVDKLEGHQKLSSSPKLGQSKSVPEYFSFDPNVLKMDEGRRLGLSDYQVKMIQNYISKGGRFYKKEDFAKIYSITELDYQRLWRYIDISERNFKPQSFERRIDINSSSMSETLPPKFLSIELNSTDSIELQTLKGIGPVFASRIIRYRDLLGGFHNKSQLLKVYGMDDERYQYIQENIYVDTSTVQKININSADYKQLIKHPYINSKQASVIVQYRNQHGNYSRVEDLLKIAIINEEFLRKIAPYLTFVDD